MAFEYTPYRSPFVGAIADLIGQRGDIAAQQALNDAKMRSQAVSSVAQSLGNLAQYQADAPKRRLEQAMLAEKQQQLADAQEGRTAARSFAAMAFDPNKGRFQPEGPSLETPTGVLPEQESFTTTTADGVELFDKVKVGQRMAELGHGAWMLEHGNKIDDLNKSLLETDAFEKQSLQKAAATWANMPEPLQLAGASQILKVMGKRLSPEQLSILRQQIDKGDVAGLRAAISPLLPKPETKVLAPGTNMFERRPDGTWKTVASGAQPQETTAQYNARVDAAFGKSEDQRTPDEQRLVNGIVARAKALEATKRLPLNDEHAALLEEKGRGPLTPEKEVRLQAIEQQLKFIPQFNVDNRQKPSDRDMTRMSDDAVNMLAVQLAANIGSARSELTGLPEDVRVRVRNAQAELNKKLERSPAAAVAVAAAAKGDAKALELLKRQQAGTSVAFDRLKPQGKLVLENIGRLNRSDWTAVNSAIDYFNKYGKQDPNVSALANAIATYTSEYAKIVEGSTASVAATTVRAQKKAEEMLPVAGSPAAIRKLIEQMEQEAAFTIDAQAKAIQAGQDRIEQMFSATPNVGQTQTPNRPGLLGPKPRNPF